MFEKERTRRENFEVAEKQTREYRESRFGAETAAQAGPEAMRQMPLYECHKKVWALKIARIETQSLPGAAITVNRSAVITPVEEGFAPFTVSAEYLAKHNPHVGGYFVQYEDGHKSFSPAKAFEDGYTPIEPNALKLGSMVRAAGLAGE